VTISISSARAQRRCLGRAIFFVPALPYHLSYASFLFLVTLSIHPRVQDILYGQPRQLWDMLFSRISG